MSKKMTKNKMCKTCIPNKCKLNSSLIITATIAAAAAYFIIRQLFLFAILIYDEGWVIFSTPFSANYCCNKLFD
jgi:hypothetical protein